MREKSKIKVGNCKQHSHICILTTGKNRMKIEILQ